MRTSLLFLSLATVAASGVAACSGSNDTPSPSPSDAGSDATALVDGSPEDAAPLSDAQATFDASDGGDATATEDAGVDASDATAVDDGGPLVRQAVLVAAGNIVVGVTSDDYVVYAAPSPDAGSGTGNVLMVIGTDGGAAQQLATTPSNVVVAGATVVWAEEATGVGDACLAASSPVSLKSWSSSHGTTVVAPLALRGGTLGIASPNASASARAVLSADGSEVAYATGCTFEDGGTTKLLTGLALARTDGTASALTFAFPSPPLDAILTVNGGAITASESALGVTGLTPTLIAGDPLAVVIPDLVDPIRDPSGAWAWEPASTGMHLVLTSTGAVVFTDPTALVGAAFDAAGANLFYAAAAGIKQIALASPVSATTLPKTAGVQPITLAPNASAVGYQVAQDGGTTYGVVTTGAASTSFATPASPQFLPDSTLYWWTNATTLSSEPVLGGPVSTVTTPGSYASTIGGSQILVTAAGGGNFVVDAQGKVPTFAIEPTVTPSAIKAPPQGGLVAYPANGGIYVVSTR